MSDALKRLITEVEAGSVRPYVIEEMAAPLFHHSVWPNIAKAYGGDLNAAKALHECLLPGWRITSLGQVVNFHDCSTAPEWWVRLDHSTSLRQVEVTSTDEARARLLAILRAYQQGQA